MNKLKNVTHNTVLSQSPKLLITQLEQAKGLMFSHERKDFGLIFAMKKEQKIPIHMVFVFYAIDVLWLDKKKVVLDMHSNCPPFHPYINHKGLAQYLIEVPKGMLVRSKTQIGDKLTWD